VVFNGTLIVGWEGLFRIEGEGEILKVALESGLGAKNSAGFGCIISKRNDKGFKGMG